MIVLLAGWTLNAAVLLFDRVNHTHDEESELRRQFYLTIGAVPYLLAVYFSLGYIVAFGKYAKNKIRGPK